MKILRLLCIGLLLCACQNHHGEDSRVKGTIMRYQQLLSEGYRKMDVSSLQQVASSEHALKVYYHMAALGEAKTRMSSTLKKIEFKDISYPDQGTALVSTHEVWDFALNSLDDGTTQQTEKDFPYEMAYDLKKDGDRWLITDARVIEASSNSDKKKSPGGN